MRELDDLLEKLDTLYFPLYVKGKEYPGNNPYIINKINNMLKAGEIKQRFGVLDEHIEQLLITDLKWDDKRLCYDEDEEYLFYKELEEINNNICDEINRLCNENNEHLSEQENTGQV